MSGKYTIFAPTSHVVACSCYVPDNASEALERSTAAFRGEVIRLKVESIDGRNYDVALLSVSEIWKGIEDTQVMVYTNWSSCNFNFEIGEEYLLYPYEHEGKLKVINCGRSAEVGVAQHDLTELGAGTQPSHEVHLEHEFRKAESIKQLALMILVVLLLAASLNVVRKYYSSPRD